MGAYHLIRQEGCAGLRKRHVLLGTSLGVIEVPRLQRLLQAGALRN